MLETKINSDNLSDYQKNLINNSDSVNKTIYIDHINDSIAKFAIEEDNNSIHLMKRKTK